MTRWIIYDGNDETVLAATYESRAEAVEAIDAAWDAGVSIAALRPIEIAIPEDA